VGNCDLRQALIGFQLGGQANTVIVTFEPKQRWTSSRKATIALTPKPRRGRSSQILDDGQSGSDARDFCGRSEFSYQAK